LVVCCLALVIAAKGALAAACLSDGIGAASLNQDAPAVASAVESGASELAASAGPSLDPPCWHGGNGGCHCNCVHSAALPVPAAAWNARIGIAADLPLRDDNALSLHAAPSLRPPIV